MSKAIESHSHTDDDGGTVEAMHPTPYGVFEFVIRTQRLSNQIATGIRFIYVILNALQSQSITIRRDREIFCVEVGSSLFSVQCLMLSLPHFDASNLDVWRPFFFAWFVSRA